MERHRRHSLTLSYRSLSCRSLYVVGRVELAGETANASLRQCAGHSESGETSRSERDAQVNLRWRLPGSTSIQETRCWRTTWKRWLRAGTLGGAARVVDSSSSLEFKRVVDAQIPRSRVHLRARAARHEHAAVRKSLTSERRRLICQASMNKSTAKFSTIRKLFPATSDSPQVAPHFCQFDSLVQTYKTGYLRGGNRNPIQRAGRWWVLHTNPGLRAAVEKPGR